MPSQRVGITGANGTIGRVLMKGLNMEGDCELTPFTRRPVDFPSTIVHFDSAAEVEGAFQNLDAVIHLAADPSPSADWERIRTHNIDAMYLVLEECRRAAVKRLVFASTNHTMHGNSILTSPETLDASTAIRMKLDDPPNPDSYYAVSKLFGENLGKLYSEQHSVEFVGLRIGWLTAGGGPAEPPSMAAPAQAPAAGDAAGRRALGHRNVSGREMYLGAGVISGRVGVIWPVFYSLLFE